MDLIVVRVCRLCGRNTADAKCGDDKFFQRYLCGRFTKRDYAISRAYWANFDSKVARKQPLGLADLIGAM